jgi:hypothetical protein
LIEVHEKIQELREIHAGIPDWNGRNCVQYSSHSPPRHTPSRTKQRPDKLALV